MIVALDEASFQRLNDLQGENVRTWPRLRWAELVSKIAEGQPRVIGLDVVFDTPFPNSPTRLSSPYPF